MNEGKQVCSLANSAFCSGVGKDESLPHLQFACQRDFRAASSSAGFWPGYVIQDLINRTGFDDGNQKTVDTKKN